MAKNSWQVPLMVGTGVVVVLAAVWWLNRRPGTDSVGQSVLGAIRPSLPSTRQRQPSRDYSDCGCGI